jgi:hypothetical protein
VWARWERTLTLYSPFCHENAAGCTNLHRSANDIATMNIRIYEVVSGYIAGIVNSDTMKSYVTKTANARMKVTHPGVGRFRRNGEKTQMKGRMPFIRRAK